jgi:hypothetical protein
MNEPFQASLSAILQCLKIKEKVLVKKWRWTSAKVINKLCMVCIVTKNYNKYKKSGRRPPYL